MGNLDYLANSGSDSSKSASPGRCRCVAAPSLAAAIALPAVKSAAAAAAPSPSSPTAGTVASGDGTQSHAAGAGNVLAGGDYTTGGDYEESDYELVEGGEVPARNSGNGNGSLGGSSNGRAGNTPGAVGPGD